MTAAQSSWHQATGFSRRILRIALILNFFGELHFSYSMLPALRKATLHRIIFFCEIRQTPPRAPFMKLFRKKSFILWRMTSLMTSCSKDTKSIKETFKPCLLSKLCFLICRLRFQKSEIAGLAFPELYLIGLCRLFRLQNRILLAAAQWLHGVQRLNAKCQKEKALIFGSDEP